MRRSWVRLRVACEAELRRSMAKRAYQPQLALRQWARRHRFPKAYQSLLHRLGAQCAAASRRHAGRLASGGGRQGRGALLLTALQPDKPRKHEMAEEAVSTKCGAERF